MLPAGFTASALVAVVPTNANGQILPLLLQNRKVSIGVRAAIQTSSTAVVAALSIASIVPSNAVSVGGNIGLNSSAVSNLIGQVFADANGLGEVGVSTTGQAASGSFEVDLSVSQNLFYSLSSSLGTPIFDITLSNYRF
jgi:hypothetical protein